MPRLWPVVDRITTLMSSSPGSLTSSILGGDNITVNTTAVTDADFDNATPAAPAAATNVRWQSTGASPTDVSAHVRARDLIAIMPMPTDRGWGWWTPDSGTSAPLSLGVNAIARLGTFTTPQPATTNYRTRRRRWQQATGATAGSAVAMDNGTLAADGAHFWRGDAADRGGWLMRFLGWSLTLNSDSRMFMGFFASSVESPGATRDPSIETDIFGLACDDDDANLMIMHNDSAGTATEIDTGIDKDAIADQVWTLNLFCPANGSTLNYRLVRLDSAVADIAGSITTNLPTNTTFGKPLIHVNNSPAGGTAVSANYQIEKAYFEWGIGQNVTDYGLVI